MKLLVKKKTSWQEVEEKEQNKNDEIPEQSTDAHEHDMKSFTLLIDAFVKLKKKVSW